RVRERRLARTARGDRGQRRGGRALRRARLPALRAPADASLFLARRVAWPPFPEEDPPMALLTGKVALVTGAGGGIGRCHALALAKEGAQLVVNDLGGTRDGSGGGGHSMADKVVAEIASLGGQAVANYDSVASVTGGERMVKAAIDAFGKLDICVNNAGILRDKTLAKLSEDLWDPVVDVHLKGTYCVSRPAYN